MRRHFSAVKGGRLAAAAGRATKITLAVSDVPKRQEAALASGPTIPDPTTVADAMDVIEKYELRARLPRRVCEWIDGGANDARRRSREMRRFPNAHFSLLLGMDDLFHPAHRAAEALGFITCCDNSTDDWPVVDAAEFLLRQLEEFLAAHGGRRVALIADGEVSSPVTGPGIGGRNCGVCAGVRGEDCGEARGGVELSGRMGSMGIVLRRGRWRMVIHWRGRASWG